MSLAFILAFAQPSGEEPNLLVSFLPFVVILAIMYFLIIRPQKKREDERKTMIEAVKKGDRIVTVGGVHGTVTQVDETSVLADVSQNVKLRIEKSAIAAVPSAEKAKK